MNFSQKCQEIHGKLIQACLKLSDVTEIVQLLYEETQSNVSNEEARVILAWTSLVQILMEHSTVAEEKFLDIVRLFVV